MNAPIRGLYAITTAGYSGTGALTAAVAAAMEGGTRLVQYRNKDADRRRRTTEATVLLGLCRAQRVPLIINDDAVLAADLGADGVHLGRDDTPPSDARRLLGPDAIIGVSCYNDIERAVAAARAGADYVAFGAFYPTRTKSTAVRASIELLRRARARLEIPIVAIGGVTPHNARPLIEAGADAVAAAEGLFGAADVRAAAQAYTRALSIDVSQAAANHPLPGV